MARNSQSSAEVAQKATGRTKQNNERRDPGVAGRPGTTPAAATTPAPPDMGILASVIGEWKHLVKSTQHQLEILTDLNIGLRKEIAMLVQKEAQARHSAYHDGLTGLPNRSLLQDRFQQAKAQAKRHHKPLALLMLDLDKFKHVNDKLGHASGDKLLQAVALRLTKGIRGADTACRYGGDEFVLMLPVIDNPAVATVLAADIGKRLGEPYAIDGHCIRLSVSIGVAVYPDDGQTLESLMKQADSAMYRAKGSMSRISITEQIRETTDTVEWNNPLATGKKDRLHQRDAFVQDRAMDVRRQPKKH